MVIPLKIVILHGTVGKVCLGVIRRIFGDRVVLLLGQAATRQAVTVLGGAVLVVEMLGGEARVAELHPAG